MNLHTKMDLTHLHAILWVFHNKIHLKISKIAEIQPINLSSIRLPIGITSNPALYKQAVYR